MNKWILISEKISRAPLFANSRSATARSKEVTSRFVTGVPLLPLSHYTLRYSTPFASLAGYCILSW